MKKKFLLIVITLFLIIIPSVIFAFDPNISEINPTIDSDLGEMVKTFLSAIRWIGYAIAIGMLIYIGVKYTMVSADEKANMKQASINFVIGAIIVAAVVTIFDWIVIFFDDAKNGDGGGGGIPGSGPEYSIDGDDLGPGAIGGQGIPTLP